MKSRADDHAVTTIWQAVSRCLGWAVTIVFVCIGLALFKPQISRAAKLDAQIEALRAEKNSAKTAYFGLRARLGWLKSEPDFLEIYARDRLDRAREGEEIFQFPDPKGR